MKNQVTSLPGDRPRFDIFGEKVSSTVTTGDHYTFEPSFEHESEHFLKWKVEPKNYSISLLHKAVKWDNIDLLRLLLDNGYNVDDCFNTKYFM